MAVATSGAALLKCAPGQEQVFAGSAFLNGGARVAARSSTVSVTSKTSLTRCTASEDKSSGGETSKPKVVRAKYSKHSHKSDDKAAAAQSGRRQLIMAGAAVGMSSFFCPICGTLPHMGGHAAGQAQAADWSYGDLSGPYEWADICKTGTAQSPIDIPLSGPVVTKDNSLGSIGFNYGSASASYLNTGHGTMQVNFPTGSNKINIAGRELELLQYHFHAPSEHSFNGVRTAMEGHLVHRDADGKLAVIGVMMEGASKVPRNLCLEAALAFGPQEKGAQIGAPVECYELPAEGNSKPQKICLKIQITPTDLLPKPDRADGTFSYIHYKGSLTTPPCSEGVDWFVLTSPLKIPDAQVVEFMRYVGDRSTLALNSRPRQDLGDRTLIVGNA